MMCSKSQRYEYQKQNTFRMEKKTRRFEEAQRANYIKASIGVVLIVCFLPQASTLAMLLSYPTSIVLPAFRLWCKWVHQTESDAVQSHGREFAAAQIVASRHVAHCLPETTHETCDKTASHDRRCF